MKFYGKRRIHRKKPSTKKRTYKKRSANTPSINRIVKRVLHSQIEDKTQFVTDSNVRLTTYAVLPALQTISMIPYNNIVQGVGQGQRIGNTIRTRRVEFNFSITPTPYSSTNSQPVPQEIIMMFGKVKNSRAQQPISSDFAHLWQAGSSNVGPYSTTLDLLQDVNKDYFTVYKVCKFKVGYATAQASGNSTANQFFANNDYKLNVTRRMNITKYCPKIVKFNDATAQPTNDGLWMWAWAVNGDGSFTAQFTPAQMSYSLNYVYEDA